MHMQIQTHIHTSAGSINIGFYSCLSLQALFLQALCKSDTCEITCEYDQKRNLNWKQNHWYPITRINQIYFPLWKHSRTFIPQSGRGFKTHRKWYFKITSIHWISKKSWFPFVGFTHINISVPRLVIQASCLDNWVWFILSEVNIYLLSVFLFMMQNFFS